MPSGRTHTPWRMCAICRERRAKRELARYVMQGDTPREDPRQILPGRGIYICQRPECIERFGKSRTRRRVRKGE